MIYMPLSLLASNAGNDNDGLSIGKINQSSFNAVLSSALVAPNQYVLRKDVFSGGFSFTDLSSVASDDNANDFEPWGTNAGMSSGDELYVACDNPIKELYFDIDTPGTGTWGSMEIKYSNNGSTPNSTVSNISDGTGAFKNTDGIYRVTFTVPSDIQAFSPVPGDVASRRWLVVRPTSVTSVTTSPKLKRMWIVHDTSGVSYVDLTSAYNSPLTNATFTGSPSLVFYPIGAERLFATPYVGIGLDWAIHRKLSPSPTAIAEYLATDDTWKTFPSYTTQSEFFGSGPTTLGGPIQYLNERWAIPTDWISKTLSFSLTSGGSQSATGYWIRHRLTNLSPYGPTAPSLVRGRTKSLGNTNTEGIQVLSPLTLKGISIESIDSISAQTVGQILNLTTGTSRNFTIPANPTLPFRIDFDDISFAGDDKLGVSFVSGGRATNIDSYLLT